MARVSPDDIRDVLNFSSADVPDAKIVKMIKRVEVTLELELGRESSKGWRVLETTSLAMSSL